MKRFLVFFSLFILVVGSLCSGVVKNPDKPLKGEWDFKPGKVWQIEGYGDELLARVQKFVIHDNGDIYLFDRTHFKFFVFDKEGKPKFTFGKRGEGPGEIKFALGFYLVGKHLIVSDPGKIHYFNLDGKFIKSALTDSTVGMAPLTFIDENRYVKTRVGPALNSAPESLEIFNLDTKKSIYLDGEPVPADKRGMGRGTMIRINIGNSQMERIPNFVIGRYGDKLLWGKNNTYLIRSSDLSGKEQFTFSVEGRKLKKITQKYKEEAVARMTFRSAGGPSPEEIKKRFIMQIPDECTYFSQIATGRSGLIYVYVSDAVREKGQEIDIFSPAGKYLYHADIDFPEVTRIVANGVVFKDDFLYVVVEEESGDYSFRKYSIKSPPAPSPKK